MNASEIVAAALGKRYTAAVLRIERGGHAVCERAFGRCAADADEPPVAVTTRFDLASLTKVFVATCALEIALSGALHLDDPVGSFLHEWRGSAHEAITLRMLLAHTAGLQSGADYRTLFAESVERYALARPLVDAPGTRVIYSDLGFIALGVLLERVAERSLASVVASSAAGLAWKARRIARETTSRVRFRRPKKMPGAVASADRCTTRKPI